MGIDEVTEGRAEADIQSALDWPTDHSAWEAEKAGERSGEQGQKSQNSRKEAVIWYQDIKINLRTKSGQPEVTGEPSENNLNGGEGSGQVLACQLSASAACWLHVFALKRLSHYPILL